MSQALSKFESLVEWISSRTNPILVKEIRQAMRSRFVLGVFFALLLIFTLVALFISWFSATDLVTSTGRGFFMWIYGVLAFATLLFVPAYSGFRIGFERAGQDPDLLFITSLKPSSIIRGKALVAAVLALFFISTGLPFMAFAYLLRGIDIPNMLTIMGLTFLASCTVSYLAILVGTIPSNKVGKAVLLLLALFGLAWMCIGAIAMVFQSLNVGGVMSALGMGSSGFGFAASSFLIVPLIVGGIGWLAHSLSTSLISPPPSNRILPVRICLTVCWAVATILFIFFHTLYPSEGFIFAILVFTPVVFAFGMLVAIGERERPGPRVGATIPANSLARAAFFPFCSGSANGITWSLGLAGLSVLIAIVYLDEVTFNGLRIYGTILLYTYAYCITGLLIRRVVFHKVVPPPQTWVIVVLLIAIISLLTFFLTDIIFSAAGIDVRLPYGNLIRFMTEVEEVDHSYFALVWALLTTLLWFPIGFKQLAAFQPGELESSEDHLES